MTERDPMNVTGVQGSTPRAPRNTARPFVVVPAASVTKVTRTVILFDNMATTKRPCRLHRCRAALAGIDNGVYIERCRCGAIRMNRRFWLERNSARKAK